MMELDGQVALVTGGARGLGAAVARQLASLGAEVAFTYLQDEESAAALKSEIEGAGRRCESFRADVSDWGLAQRTVAGVLEKFGRLDILISNAGVARGAPIWKATEADWDLVLGVTLKGAFNYIRAAAPVFMKQNRGKVVCVGSINGLRGRIGTVGYNVAKAGLVGLVKTAAAELGAYNVNVNLIAPGFIDTPSQQNTPELIRDLVLKECAIKRLGAPEDVAPMVTFLCTEAARHVTGQVIKVDAGQYL